MTRMAAVAASSLGAGAVARGGAQERPTAAIPDAASHLTLRILRHTQGVVQAVQGQRDILVGVRRGNEARLERGGREVDTAIQSRVKEPREQLRVRFLRFGKIAD